MSEITQEGEPQMNALTQSNVNVPARIAMPATAKAMGVAADHVLIDRVAQRLGDSVADAAGDWGADLIVIGTPAIL